ncbi:hypothetical protein RD110_02000 [Rhodoferax koreense]|uniref:Haem-binding uptake Tiki superfamily ChaN domain-containing protein n=1 Tax=Rhodoferax koreensis TaxID=1842727 RepID=A0A1P8JQX9_9BURK|nr:ChaN family lipoprotein [Rhodoferax koreense]APW36131.1 hypothetical protein RD110_02000 [Rhodoferax koreense]
MQVRRLSFAFFPSLLLAMLIGGCAGTKPPSASDAISARILALPPADAVLLGEQHDAAEHQRIEQRVVASFAERGRLAALVIEMAERGRSTAGLPPDASEARVQAVLAWDLKGWPWSAYGPAVMTAVRAGVPVLGANLQRLDMREAMGNRRLDDHLPDAALQIQRQAIRAGHCEMLPEAQIAPMTRIQIARDRSMAHTIAEAAMPGKVVVLLAGSGHVANGLGVPLHLPPTLKVRTVRLLAEGRQAEPATAFDAVWPTPAVPAKDYCADMKQQMGGSSQ